MKKRIIKPALPLLLAVALVITVCGSTGTSLGKYVFSQDVSTLSLVVKPKAAPEVQSLDINTENVQNISVSEVYPASANIPDAEECYALLFAADEGYLLPETITVVIGEETYEISTVQPEGNPEGFRWVSEENILLIPRAACPEEGFSIAISAIAVPEAGEANPIEEEEKQAIALVLNLANIQSHAEKEPMAAEDFKLTLIPDEGYKLPDHISVNIDGVVFTVFTNGTSPEATAPAFDAESGMLSIPGVLITETTKTITVTVAAPTVDSSEEPPDEEENPGEEPDSGDGDRTGNPDEEASEELENPDGEQPDDGKIEVDEPEAGEPEGGFTNAE